MASPIDTALGDEHAELAALLDPLDEEGWQRPTRCDGWTVADVVLYFAQTDELALTSVAGSFGDERRARRRAGR